MLYSHGYYLLTFNLPTITAIMDRIYFINMSFEHFSSDQFTFRYISHFIRYLFNGFVLFALLVLLEQYITSILREFDNYRGRYGIGKVFRKI